MSASDDRPDEMFGDDELDTDFDMLLDGVAIDPRLVPLTRIVDDVHIVAGGPPPSPTVELAAVLRGDLVADEDLSPGAASAARTARRCAPPSPRPASRQRSLARIPSRLAAMSLAAKAALGLAMAGAGAVGAGVAGVLPDPAADVVRRAVEAVTPFELPDAGADVRDDQGAVTSANAEPDQIDPGTANTEVTIDDAAAPEAGRAGRGGIRRPVRHTPSARPTDLTTPSRRAGPSPVMAVRPLAAVRTRPARRPDHPATAHQVTPGRPRPQNHRPAQGHRQAPARVPSPAPPRRPPVGKPRLHRARRPAPRARLRPDRQGAGRLATPPVQRQTVPHRLLSHRVPDRHRRPAASPPPRTTADGPQPGAAEAVRSGPRSGHRRAGRIRRARRRGGRRRRLHRGRRRRCRRGGGRVGVSTSMWSSWSERTCPPATPFGLMSPLVYRPFLKRS